MWLCKHGQRAAQSGGLAFQPGSVDELGRRHSDARRRHVRDLPCGASGQDGRPFACVHDGLLGIDVSDNRLPVLHAEFHGCLAFFGVSGPQKVDEVIDQGSPSRHGKRRGQGRAVLPSSRAQRAGVPGCPGLRGPLFGTTLCLILRYGAKTCRTGTMNSSVGAGSSRLPGTAEDVLIRTSGPIAPQVRKKLRAVPRSALLLAVARVR